MKKLLQGIHNEISGWTLCEMLSQNEDMLFLLSKAMLYLLERKFADANPILHQTGPMIEAWVQQNTHHQKESVAKQQKEYLQIFFLVLQVKY